MNNFYIFFVFFEVLLSIFEDESLVFSVFSFSNCRDCRFGINLLFVFFVFFEKNIRYNK